MKRRKPLGRYIRRSLKQYFADLDGANATNLHQILTEELEQELFTYAMRHVKGNRTHAAAMLGISRSTLQRKLAYYEIE